MYSIKDISKMSREFADAQTDFISEIDRIANKYGVPYKVAREIAYQVLKEVDLDDTFNS